MQFKNDTAIVHVTAGVRSMHTLYVIWSSDLGRTRNMYTLYVICSSDLGRTRSMYVIWSSDLGRTRSMYTLYVIWSSDLGRTLKCSTLLLVGTRRQCYSSYLYCLCSLLPSSEATVCTGCCNTLDHILTYLFKKLSRQKNPMSPSPMTPFLRILELNPGLLQQMLSSIMNIIMFEHCRNQWSISRPLLGLILLNEEVKEGGSGAVGEWEGGTDEWMDVDRWTTRQTHKQAGWQADTDRQTDRQTLQILFYTIKYHMKYICVYYVNTLLVPL